MSRRKHNLPEHPSLLADASPGATTVLAGGEGVQATSAPILREVTQLDRANALARAREDGYREGVIATMAECAAIVQLTARDLDDGLGISACNGIANAILAELHRRFPNNPRVAHHLSMRGLA